MDLKKVSVFQLEDAIYEYNKKRNIVTGFIVDILMEHELNEVDKKRLQRMNDEMKGSFSNCSLDILISYQEELTKIKFKYMKNIKDKIK